MMAREVAIWDDVITVEERRAYEKAGWGGKVGFGMRPALLVTDMYRAFVDPAYPFSSETSVETASQISVLLEGFRRRSLPVFFTTERPSVNAADRGRWKVKAADGAQMSNPMAYEIWPAIAPLPGESVMVKTYPSAFFGTTLSSQLIYHSIDTLVVTGTVTSGCVRATCLDAFNYNFRRQDDAMCSRPHRSR